MWLETKLTAPLLLGLTLAAATNAATLGTGDILPDLRAFELEGKLPDQLSGKIIILDFWASWCGPCAHSFPMLEDLHKNHHEEGLEIIAVSVDEKNAAMQAFLKKHPVSFTVVRDAKQKLVAKVNVKTMPTTFVLDRQGKVRFVHSGFHGEETRKQLTDEIETLLKEK